jgi:hypothetical protein
MCSCADKTTEMTPIDIKINGEDYSKYIVLISESIDTSLINENLSLEKLNYDIKYVTFRPGEFCCIIKFTTTIPDYLFNSVMADCVMNQTKTIDSYVLNINNKKADYSYILRYSTPNFNIKNVEYYYGKFANGKTFVINLLESIDNDINKCAFYYNETPFNEEYNTFLNKSYFKPEYLTQIQSYKDADTITVRKH